MGSASCKSNVDLLLFLNVVPSNCLVLLVLFSSFLFFASCIEISNPSHFGHVSDLGVLKDLLNFSVKILLNLSDETEPKWGRFKESYSHHKEPLCCIPY